MSPMAGLALLKVRAQLPRHRHCYVCRGRIAMARGHERLSRNDSVGAGERARLGRSGPRPRGPHRAWAKGNHSVRVDTLGFGARAHRTTAEAAVLPYGPTESFRLRVKRLK